MLTSKPARGFLLSMSRLRFSTYRCANLQSSWHSSKSRRQQQLGGTTVSSQAQRMDRAPYVTDGYDDENSLLGQSQTDHLSTEQHQPAYAGSYGQQPYPQSYPTPEASWGPGARCPPPTYTAWHPEHVNSVRLIGYVGTAPLLKTLPGGKAVVNVSLGIRKSINNTAEKQWMRVEFWDIQAFQVAQYVQKGMQIAVGGRLQQDEWTNDRGEPRSRTKVVAANFSIVMPSVPQPHLPWDNTAPSASSSSQGHSPSLETNGNASTPAYQSQGPTSVPTTPKLPRGKAKRLFSQWRNYPGITWGRLAAEQGETLAPKMLNPLVEGILGCPDVTQEEVTRLAAELQIGEGEDTPFMTAQELNTALDSAWAANPGETLEKLRLSPIREQLISLTPEKVDIQERGSASLGQTVTYSQIRLAKFCRQKRLALGELVQGDPRKMKELFENAALPA